MQRLLPKTLFTLDRFNDNMLRPCPVTDNPGRLAEMVNKTGAHNTDPMAHESA